MIQAIHAQDFKGLTFDQPLQGKNLIIGPNRIGKSARLQALSLCLLGYVPCIDKPKKQNAEIMQAFATKDAMIVGVSANDHKYERRFVRSKKTGTVSQKFRIDGGSWTLPKSQFDGAIYNIPKPLDLSVFMSMSDPKKIDYLYKLYPPKGELKDLESDIEKCEEDLKAKQAELTSAKNLCVSIEQTLSGIDLPPGSLEELELELTRVRHEYKLVRDSIVRAEEQQAAEVKAKELAAKLKEQQEAEERGRQLAKQKEEAKAKEADDIIKSNNDLDALDKETEPKEEPPFTKMPPSGPPPGANVGIVQTNKPVDEQKSNFTDLATSMNPLAARVSNELIARARAAIKDLMAIADKVDAHAVVMKGAVYLKQFTPVDEPEKY